jgi:tetratricopeptide (TPR) repeat protein
VIQFIHDAKTDRDKARLFAACRTGAVAVLVGSTEKMGVGTNVQDRAIALHHLDAPWRPADVAQREGRIIRQGNLNRQLGRDIEIIRYVTAQSFDGYMWQTLERKARFIHQVMHGRLDTRDITDIGDTALSFSEVKAIATGNPLLIDKAEADTALARLQRAERAHQRNQQALRQAVTDYETEISRLTALAAAIDTAIAQRQDTRGEKFTMTVGGIQHSKRADAGQHAKDILDREAAALTGQLRRTATIGRLAGFAVNAELSRALGATNVTISLDGAPGTTIEMPASGLRDSDPLRLVTRLEHRLAQLETRQGDALAEIDHARRQIAHARASIGEQFPHAEELAAASQRVREIDEALDRMAQQPPGHAATTEQAIPSADSRQQAEAQRAGAVPGTAHLATPRSAHDVAAQREQDARQPAAAQVGNSGRTQANRAAVAANDAYKAGDLDRARDLTEQAAALDPSRAGLWQQHRNDIAARQLIISAQAAHADGNHERADKLLQDARQLDPRLRTLWDGSLPAQPAAQLAQQAPGSGTTAPEADSTAGPIDLAATAAPAERASQPAWPSAPARREPDRSGLAAAQPGGTQPAAQGAAGAAGPREPRAAATASADGPDADSGGGGARWPSRNPRSQSPAAARPRAADRDISTAPQAAPEDSRQSQTAPAAGPTADWRDQILSDARQPWQPSPSWPHHPAIHQTPQAATPDTGIAPDAEP